MARVSSGTLTVLVFALLIGLGGAYVVRQQLAQAKPIVAPPAPEAPSQAVIVPVAAVDLQPGQTPTINEVAILRLSREQFAKSKYVGVPFMRDSQQIANRTLRNEIKQGEPFLTTSFYPEGSGPGIAEMLKPGYRAVTIPIQDVAAVYGFARPGSFVDVLFRSEPTDDRPEVTLTLLERIEVLAVKKNIVSEQAVELSDDGTVTLAVTPSQAKILKVVENRGVLSLTLRNPKDEMDVMPVDLTNPDAVRAMAGIPPGTVPIRRDGSQPAVMAPPGWWLGRERVLSGTDQVSLDDLLGTPPKPKPSKMVIYHGGQKQVVRFDDDEEEQPSAPQLIDAPINTPVTQYTTRGRLPRRIPTVNN